MVIKYSKIGKLRTSWYIQTTPCQWLGISKGGEPWPRGTVVAWHAGGAGLESPRGQHFVQP